MKHNGRNYSGFSFLCKEFPGASLSCVRSLQRLSFPMQRVFGDFPFLCKEPEGFPFLCKESAGLPFHVQGVCRGFPFLCKESAGASLSCTRILPFPGCLALMGQAPTSQSYCSWMVTMALQRHINIAIGIMERFEQTSSWNVLMVFRNQDKYKLDQYNRG